MSFTFSVLLVATLAAAPMAFSQEAGEPDPPPAASADENPKIPEPQGIETVEEEEEEFDRHHVALVTAGSRKGSENGFTLGGEYEYRFHRMLGAGVMAEYTWNFREDVFVFPVYFHPGAGLILAAGPGIDRPVGGESESSGDAEGDSEGSSFLFRFEVQYEFELGKGFTLAPSATVDFVDGSQVWAYGVSFGYGF